MPKQPCGCSARAAGEWGGFPACIEAPFGGAITATEVAKYMGHSDIADILTAYVQSQPAVAASKLSVGVGEPDVVQSFTAALTKDNKPKTKREKKKRK